MRAAKDRVRQTLKRAGFELRRVAHGTTMDAALMRVATRGAVATIIDVGASNGSWTRMARHHFPSANYLLIEAQANPHEPALRALKAQHQRIDYVIAAAGDAQGSVHFDATDAFGGAASHEPAKNNDIVVPMTTVDAEVASRQLPPPYLLKLDTHGFEVPILHGAKRTLEHTSVLVVEAYNFELQPGCLRFHELCEFVEQRGLRCIDLVDIMHRPKDGALWQFDLFFAPAGRPEFESNTYR